MIDAEQPRQKPEDARRQDLTVREWPTRIAQRGQNTGKTQPVRGLLLPHNLVEVGSIQRVVLGDLPVVVRDGCCLLTRSRPEPVGYLSPTTTRYACPCFNPRCFFGNTPHPILVY